MTTRSGWVPVLLWCALAGPVARADQWGPPVPLHVASPQGLYRATIQPGEPGPGSWDVDGPIDERWASAELTGPHGRLRFTIANPVAPLDAVLFDDGVLVTFDNHHSMGFGRVVAAYEPSGRLRWALRLRDLLPGGCGSPLRTMSSIWWRQSSPSVGPRGEILVRLWQEDELAIAPADGKVTHRPREPGDDPEALLRRANSLIDSYSSDGDPPCDATKALRAAVAYLERAVALAPTLVDLRHAMARARVEQGDLAAAIASYREGLSALSGSEGTRTYWISAPHDPTASLHCGLAEVHDRANQQAEATAAWAACFAREPDHWEALAKLAPPLLSAGRDDELARLFEVHWQAQILAPHLLPASLPSVLVDLARRVGLAWARSGRHERALATFRRAYPRHADQYSGGDLGEAMAETLLILGRHQEGAEVLRDVRARVRVWLKAHPRNSVMAQSLARVEGCLGDLRSSRLDRRGSLPCGSCACRQSPP